MSSHRSPRKPVPSLSPIRNTRFGKRPQNSTGLIGILGFSDDGVTTGASWHEAVLTETQRSIAERQLRAESARRLREEYAAELKQQIKHAKRVKRHEHKVTEYFDRLRTEQDLEDVKAMVQVLSARKLAERHRTDHNAEMKHETAASKAQEKKRLTIYATDEHPWNFDREVKERQHVFGMKQLCREDYQAQSEDFAHRKRRQLQSKVEEEAEEVVAQQCDVEFEEAKKQEAIKKRKEREHMLERRSLAVAHAIGEREQEVISRRSMPEPSPYTPRIFREPPAEEAAVYREWRRSDLDRKAKYAQELQKQLQEKQAKANAVAEAKIRNRDSVRQAVEAMNKTAFETKMQHWALQKQNKAELLAQAIEKEANPIACETDLAVKPYRPHPPRALVHSSRSIAQK